MAARYVHAAAMSRRPFGGLRDILMRVPWITIRYPCNHAPLATRV
jgi:hypothetical protein